MKKLLAGLVILLVLVSCDTPTNDSNNNAPTLTDIKIVTDISQLLTGPYLTTLTVGTEYAVLFFMSDQDLDITKIFVDYYKDNTFVTTQEIPVFGQTTVTEVFLSYYTPAEVGAWKAEAYLEDAKGKKSNKKSITYTVNDTETHTHEWGNWTTTTPATCTTTGTQTRICALDTTHIETQALPIDPAAHDWGNWTQTTAPTCITAGIETRVCNLDPTHTETRAGAAAIGHDWGDWEVTTAPTATADGEETRTCKNDATHTETQTVPATGSNGDTPTLTDIKIAADIDHILTGGPYLTTLNAGTEYVVLIFASDQDLDISKFVVDYINDGIFVTTVEIPTFGQATVSELFVGYFTPPEPGTWKVEVYVEDAKGNKSSKKSITVIVNSVSTININNNSGSSVSATIYYGNQREDVVLDEGFTKFTFQSTGTTACRIRYSGRYILYTADTDTFNVPQGGTYPITFNADIGWIQLRNSTSTNIRYPQYGELFFLFDANGNLLTTDDASTLLIGEDQYCRITSSGYNYITFWYGTAKLRLSSSTICSLGTTQLVILTGSTSVVEE